MTEFRSALRSLRRRPGFTVLAATMLALGIGSTTAVFSVVNGVLLKPLPYEAPEQLVRVHHENERESRQEGFSRQDWPDVQRAALPFEELAGYLYERDRVMLNVGLGEGVMRLQAAFVSGNTFRALGVAPLLGRAFDETQDVEGAADYIVLSENAWRTYFGASRDVIGMTVPIEGRPFTVTGVMPRMFQFPARDVQVWAPLALLDTTSIGGGRDYRWIQAVARLSPGQDAGTAERALEPVLRNLARQYPETNADWTSAAVVPLKTSLTGDVRRALLVLLGAVGLVLLIACANLANLLLARATGRSRELAVRCALGADRQRLARQILVENVVLAVIGGAAGLVVSVWMVELLVHVGSMQIPRPDEVGLDWVVVLFAVAATLLTSVLASVLPAMRAGGTQPGDALREGARGGTSGARTRARSALVMVETAVAVLLLTGALLMTRSLWTLLRTDPGFDAQSVVAVTTSMPSERFEDRNARLEYRDRLLTHLREVPGVVAVAGGKTLPLTGGSEPLGELYRTMPDGSRRVFNPEAGTYIVSAGYFETLSIPLLAGREFEATDRPTDESTEVPIIISAAAHRQYWPNENPIGQLLNIDDVEIGFRIIGIVGDVRTEGLAAPAAPAAYIHWDAAPRSLTNVFVRVQGDPAQSLARIRAAVQSFDRELPLGAVQPLTALIGQDVAVPRFQALLLGLFALTAVVIAGLGIYGVIAYTVQLRAHEIGVRLALGADRRDVMRMVVGQAMRISGAGLAIGLLAALWASSALEGMLHGVSTHDAVSFGVVPVLLGLLALTAAAVPAYRAASTDPMVTFRND